MIIGYKFFLFILSVQYTPYLQRYGVYLHYPRQMGVRCNIYIYNMEGEISQEVEEVSAQPLESISSTISFQALQSCLALHVRAERFLLIRSSFGTQLPWPDAWLPLLWSPCHLIMMSIGWPMNAYH